MSVEQSARDFWKFAGSYKGVSTFDSVFEDWANKQASLSVSELDAVWDSVQLDLCKAFDRTAAITISGEPEELQQMFGKGAPATEPARINAPKIENPIKQAPPAGVKPPMGAGPLPGAPAGLPPMPPAGPVAPTVGAAPTGAPEGAESATLLDGLVD